MAASARPGVATAPQELTRKDEWVKQDLIAEKAALPFSFTYGGQPSAALLPTWERKAATNRLDDKRTEHVLTWTDAKTGLEVRCRAVEYSNFPVVEWTVYFKNIGKADTPILADIQGMDVSFKREGPEKFVLRTTRGDDCTASSYQPVLIPLGDGARQRFAPVGGWPTNGAFPYFNIAWDDQGVIAVLGWPGQWVARFECDQAQNLRIVGGQELTKLKLLPGEEIRTPLSVLLFWKGDDWLRAQNLWRRWMVVHNLPRPGGKVVTTHYGSCWSATLNPSAEEELAILDGFEREGIKLDYYFIDAGWYIHPGAWSNTGTWEIDAKRFPKGVREVADRVHKNGAKFVLWFEPERCVDGSWLAVQHPEWLLKSGGTRLVNLGHPEAWKWVVQRMDGFITSQAIDVYRQDFNTDPLGCWRAADAPDRQGITEMRHVQGYLALWDEILRRHPDLYIDTCASGGRRNDLETLRRSVPLLRSDYAGNVESQQTQTMGLALWVPYFGSGMGPNDVYWYRSSIFPASRIGMDTRRKDQDHALLKRMMAEFHRCEKYLLGDFYPLTDHSLAQDAWVAWQFDRPELGEGIVQAFRRAQAKDGEMRFKLRGLDRGALYDIEDFDKAGTTRVAGRELMEKGLPVTSRAREAAIIHYRRVSAHSQTEAGK